MNVFSFNFMDLLARMIELKMINCTLSSHVQAKRRIYVVRETSISVSGKAYENSVQTCGMIIDFISYSLLDCIIYLSMVFVNSEISLRPRIIRTALFKTKHAIEYDKHILFRQSLPTSFLPSPHHQIPRLNNFCLQLNKLHKFHLVFMET